VEKPDLNNYSRQYFFLRTALLAVASEINSKKSVILVIWISVILSYKTLIHEAGSFIFVTSKQTAYLAALTDLLLTEILHV